jgi:hypothetical protein
MTINIAKGTKVLDSTLNSLTQISVAPIASPAEAREGYHIIKSFNFDPDGAQFAPGITVTVSFDASIVEDSETLVLAFYNETDDEWEFVEGTNNGDGTATFNITHFSVYALMYQDDSSEPIAPVQEDSEHSDYQLIIIVAVATAAVLAIALIIWQIKRRRPSVQSHRRLSKSSKRRY